MGVLRTSILLISVVLEVGGLLTAMVAGRGFFQSDEVSVGVLDHRRVNLHLHVWLGWCARRTQGFILVRVECPYVQFEAARVTDTCL